MGRWVRQLAQRAPHQQERDRRWPVSRESQPLVQQPLFHLATVERHQREVGVMRSLAHHTSTNHVSLEAFNCQTYGVLSLACDNIGNAPTDIGGMIGHPL